MPEYFDDPPSKKELVKGVLEGKYLSCVPLKHALKGNLLWTVLPKADGTAYICMVKLLRDGKGYGFKAITEYEGPFYYTCPVSWFKKYPTQDAQALEWRGLVREAHKKSLRKVNPGDMATYAGVTYKIMRKIVGKNSWVVATEDGIERRVSSRLLKEMFEFHDEEEEPFDPVEWGWVGKDGRP